MYKLQVLGNETVRAMGAALLDEEEALPLAALWPPAEGLRAGAPYILSREAAR